MRCSKAKRYIDLMLDSELKQHQQDKLQRHLISCPACRKWQTEAQAMQHVLSLAPEVEVPAWIHAQIMDKVQLLDRRHPTFVRRFKLATATAALAILLSTWAGMKVGITSFQSSDETQTGTVSVSTYSGFGENTMLDSYLDLGDSNE